MYAWLGALVRMGLAPMRSTRDYWNTKLGVEIPGITSIMSESIFRHYLESLCLYSPDDDGDDNILKKVQLMIDVFNCSCKKAWKPSQWVAVDEGRRVSFWTTANRTN